MSNRWENAMLVQVAWDRLNAKRSLLGEVLKKHAECTCRACYVYHASRIGETEQEIRNAID